MNHAPGTNGNSARVSGPTAGEPVGGLRLSQQLHIADDYHRPRHILVTGSRDVAGPHAAEVIGRALVSAWMDLDRPHDAVLISGHCPTGVDALAEKVWRAQGYAVNVHPANWKQYGKRAGYVRNKTMADLLRPGDLVLAFVAACRKPGCDKVPYPHDSHGTSMMMDLARERGYEPRVYRLDGCPDPDDGIAQSTEDAHTRR